MRKYIIYIMLAWIPVGGFILVSLEYFKWYKGIIHEGLDIVTKRGYIFLAIKTHIDTSFRYNESCGIYFSKGYKVRCDDKESRNIYDERIKEFILNEDLSSIVAIKDNGKKVIKFYFDDRYKMKYFMSLNFYDTGIPSDITIVDNEDSIKNYKSGYFKIKDKWLIQFMER